IARARQLLQAQETTTIVDMGTGSGNIAVSLAVHLPQARVLACDVSETAVALTQYHAEKHAVADRVQVLCGDMFTPLADEGIAGQVDIVVCNPPYIPTGSLANLATEIIEHEPVVALDAGAYGIDIFRRLIRGAQDFLKPGGLLAFEIGAGQHRMAARLVQKNKGYETAVPIKLDSIIRVITAIKKETASERER
ncbi:MAG: N5-glutamine methyltransferase family protein, partial [Anaerolineae bacterium]